ncbi:MAG TPA: glucosaminidase domain-containing protein [Flavobacteriales bacterium]|nr:glucosaminidase domain-containing protein [Flavobacteriales bacterium]
MLNKKIAILVLAFSCLYHSVFAQPAERRYSRKEYVERWKDEAVKQMNTYGIPASITLAQALLESADGNSPLAKYANNHFGIKCHDWTGETFIQDDDKNNECFRKYENAEDSYNDHSLFLKTRSRYDQLFTLAVTDYKGWAHGLKKAGYATNPQYGWLLIQVIEENNLNQYDREPLFAHKNIKPEKKTVLTASFVKHDVKVHDNKIKFIIAKNGDTPFKIAKEFEMGLWQIYKYNDLGKNDGIKEGDVVYLQPKRSKAQFEFHTVTNGDSMKKISQMYGVKLKKLYKRNNMKPGTEPKTGNIIYLRKSI